MSLGEKNIVRNFLKLIKTGGSLVILFFIIHFLLNWGAYNSRLDYYFQEDNITSEYTDTVQKIWAKSELVPQKQTKLLSSIDLDFSQRSKAILGLENFNFEVYPNDNRIYVPKINQNAPISWTDLDKENVESTDYLQLEKKLQEALKNGIVHYPGTALPGEEGNAVFTGHSSYYPWAPGDYKSIFALLDKVDLNDEIIVFHNQIKYVYYITDKRVVKPTAMDVLNQATNKRMLTLITCTPVGTDINRLVVTAEIK